MRTSARAISSLRRSPPESVYAGCFATFIRSNGASSSSARALRAFAFSGSVSRIAITFSHTVSLRKIDASCARYPSPLRARLYTGRRVMSSPRKTTLPPSGFTSPTTM